MKTQPTLSDDRLIQISNQGDKMDGKLSPDEVCAMSRELLQLRTIIRNANQMFDNLLGKNK